MADKPRQQDYWDENLDAQNLGGAVSDSPESLLEELKFSSIPDIEEMIAHLAPVAGLRILDIGTGLGANAALIRTRGATVIALDISHERLAALKARTNRLSGTSRGKILPIKARAEALPFRNESLDGAYTRAVLIHTDVQAVCREVARTLKPGAPVAFSEPTAHNPLVKLYRMTLAPREWRGITQYFTRHEIRMVSGEFGEVKVRRFYGPSFIAFFFQYAVSSPVWFYRALHAMMKVDNGLEWLWPGSDKYAWFVLITGRKSDS